MYTNFDKSAELTAKMDALYKDVGFHVHKDMVDLDSRKPIFALPDTCITQKDRTAFYSGYTFGVALKKENKSDFDDTEIGYRYVADFIPMVTRIVHRALSDKRTGMTEEQYKKLLDGIWQVSGMDNPLDDSKKGKSFVNKQAKLAFIGDIETQVPANSDVPTYGYIMFHCIPRLGVPFNIQAIATFQSTERPHVPISGYTCDTKVFDITINDSTSDVEDNAPDSLYKSTYFGERCVKQTWPEDKNDIFIKILGCLCDSCRKEVANLQKDKEFKKNYHPCFFGNEFLDPSDRFCFDTERMNLLCRWLYYPMHRSKALKHKPWK